MVKNVLKDGTVIKDLKGHVVTKEDCPGVYAIFESVNKNRKKKGEDE